MADLKAIQEKMIQTSLKFVESSDREIEWLNKQIAEQREKDRNFVEWVWSKGVVDEWEMGRFTKNYKSEEMKNLLKQRQREYKWRASQRKYAEKWSRI